MSTSTWNKKFELPDGSSDEKHYDCLIGYLHNDYKIKSLEKYNTVSEKVSADIKKVSDSNSVYNKKFLKTKINCHEYEVTDFYDKEICKLNSNHTCLDSALKKDGKYYAQVFSKEWKDIVKKIIKHVNGSFNYFSYSN